MIQFPQGQFDISLSDPAWQYNQRCDTDRMRGGAVSKYDLMSTDQICQLPVREISADRGLCFLWVTAPFMDDGIRVMEAWGYDYKTVAFTWIKTNRGKGGIWVRQYELQEKISRAYLANTGEYDPEALKADPAYAKAKFFFGNGFYTKANPEYCLLGLKKGSKRTRKPCRDDVSSVVVAPIREHSRKPWEVAYRIEAMYPTERKLELFCREKRPGWEAWGNEVSKF